MMGLRWPFPRDLGGLDGGWKWEYLPWRFCMSRKYRPIGENVIPCRDHETYRALDTHFCRDEPLLLEYLTRTHLSRAKKGKGLREKDQKDFLKSDFPTVHPCTLYTNDVLRWKPPWAPKAPKVARSVRKQFVRRSMAPNPFVVVVLTLSLVAHLKDGQRMECGP